METDDTELAELRGLIERNRNRRGRVRLVGETRERVVGFAMARLNASATLDEVSAELGIPRSSVERWRSEQGKPRKMVRVRVSKSKPSQRLVVRGPCGLQVEGLDLGGVCELFRRLS